MSKKDQILRIVNNAGQSPQGMIDGQIRTIKSHLAKQGLEIDESGEQKLREWMQEECEAFMEDYIIPVFEGTSEDVLDWMEEVQEDPRYQEVAKNFSHLQELTQVHFMENMQEGMVEVMELVDGHISEADEE